MIYVVISLTALAASFITFFSGFGLGTLLMPVFALFFDLPTAIALTAIVHLLNNIFKLGLVHLHINYKILWQFGIPALLASFAGAWMLQKISHSSLILYVYYLGEKEFNITWHGLIIGLVILFFSIVELNKKLSEISFNSKFLIPGAILTGFFGGLSGHQGALRTAFLLRMKLDKAVFIATGVAIACLVDVARLSVYSFSLKQLGSNTGILIAAILSAFLGAFIGNKVFQKTSIVFIKWIIGIFMFAVSLLIIAGIINK
ncbi:MAG: sulfite exporter TauE/SafE family protein [Bacteroidota bacterium]|nr:sulfite exporter TauE/SafE family protein [Bacteroidota bacterium]